MILTEDRSIKKALYTYQYLVIHVEFGIFKQIGRVNYKWFKNADRYTNAITGTDRPGKWFPQIDAVQYNKPFHRTTVGHDHTYFVLDFDVELLDYPQAKTKDNRILERDIKLRICLNFIKDWLDTHPKVKFFAKISGSGIHLIQRYNKRIDPQRFQGIPKILFPKCQHAPDIPTMTRGHPPLHVCDEHCTGWHHPYTHDERDEWRPNEKKWAKIVTYQGHRVSINIDLKMFERVHMIRWTYSPNLKIQQRFNWSIPIDDWNPDWVLTHMYRQNMSIHEYDIPDFQWEHLLIPESKLYDMDISKKSRDNSSEFGEYYRLNIPEPNEELTPMQQYTIDRLDTVLTADETVVPPCVKAWYEKSKTTSGVHDGRVVWVRWLAAKKYTPEEIGLLMRFKVNDLRDNNESNREILHEQMSKYAFGPRENPFKIMGCKKLQYHGEPTRMDIKIADEKMCELCRRTHPLQNYPSKQITGDPNKGFEEIQRKVIDILDRHGTKNLIVTKATRAGLTTTIIPIAKGLGKKLLVVVPTNRIGKETFVKAVRLAKTKFNLEVNGAMFAANRNACLILTILDRELKKKRRNPPTPTWKNPLAWSALRYHTKPSCTKCKFKDDMFNIPLMNNGIPVPMMYSEITHYQDGTKGSKGNCAYITLQRQIRDLDVVFITYSKLFALFATDSEDSDYFRQQLFECFDVLLLDEVSHLTNHSAFTIKLLQSKTILPGDSKTFQYAKFSYNMLLRLENEISAILNYSNTKITRKIEEFVRKFITFYEPMLDNPIDKMKTLRVDNFLPDHEIDYINDNFAAFHKVLEKAALDANISLTNIEATLFLLKEKQWMLSSIPTNFNPVDISLIIEPATKHVKKFVRDFSNYHNKQVIITDATMPYVNMMEFFQLRFEKYEIGDPRGTNKSQLIIADSKNVNVTQLFFNKDNSFQLQHDLFDFINNICAEHGEKNIMIICANIATANLLKNAMTVEAIPRTMITWFRSDMTIGVESDKRIIIAICPPYPPRGSHDWLAFYFHLDAIHLEMSISELGAHLAENSAKIAFYQAIGRGKDPEVQERSVVYCWGISGGRQRLKYDNQNIMELMNFDDNVPTPNIFNPSHLDARSPEILKVGKIWLRDGKIISPLIIRIARIVKNRTQVTLSELSRIMRINITELEKTITENNVTTLREFDIQPFDLLSRGKKYKGLRYVKGLSRIPDSR